MVVVNVVVVLAVVDLDGGVAVGFVADCAAAVVVIVGVDAAVDGNRAEQFVGVVVVDGAFEQKNGLSKQKLQTLLSVYLISCLLS